MSIYIGKTPISLVQTSLSIISSNNSTPIMVDSTNKESFLEFQEYRFGQYREGNTNSLQLYHSNILLFDFNSNVLNYKPNTLFSENVIGQSSIQIGGNFTVPSTLTSNLVLELVSGIPLQINDFTNGTLCKLTTDAHLFIASNLRIGTTSIQYPLEISGSMRVQSNLIIDQTLYGQTLSTDKILSKQNGASYIEWTPNMIRISADETIFYNPLLKGNILYDTNVNLTESTVDQLESSNVQINNIKTDQASIFIIQSNIGGFANTAIGNPIRIDSYFNTANRFLPIFVIDTIGRITSGKTTFELPELDDGYHYYIDEYRYPYISGFIRLSSCNLLEQMAIDKRGFISLGSNQPKHPLEIVHAYTGYETYDPKIHSMIGLYQPTSNQVPYLIGYDKLSGETIFKITEKGKYLFEDQPFLNDDFQIETYKKGYIQTLNTCNILSELGVINFHKSAVCNVANIQTNTIYTESAVLSNIYFYNLHVDDIELEALDYISDSGQNEELRIIPERFLFTGSNLVFHPNPNFFINEPGLPHDNIRIYANGSTTANVNVIQTIGSHQISQLRMVNSNDMIGSSSRIQFKVASQPSYSFGIINNSTVTGSGQAEAFITSNSDLSDTDRALSIHPLGIRVGNKIHIHKDGTTTIGRTIPKTRVLTVQGEVELFSSAGISSMFVSNNGFIGIGTNQPQTEWDIRAPSAYMSGNMGIGTRVPGYNMDVAKTIRAHRILGVYVNDIIGLNTSLWQSSTPNIYYTKGNVGIGTTLTNSILHIHTCNLSSKNAMAFYTSNDPLANVKLTTYPFTEGYNVIPSKPLSQMNIQSRVIIGSNSLPNYPSDSMYVNGSIGIGTTFPLSKLHVQGNVRYIGACSNDAEFYIGIQNQSNIGGTGLYFGEDATYENTVIENRVYVPGTATSELLLFKGDGVTYPRIRFRGKQIKWDVYPSATLDRTIENTVVQIDANETGGHMTIYDTLITSNLQTSKVSSIDPTYATILDQDTYFTAGTYELKKPPQVGCSYARIQMWGAGGGGGGGNIQGSINSSGIYLGGGGGGGGGAYGEVIIPYELLINSTLTSIIGTGGVGGTQGSISTTITTTTNSINATAGTSGTATTLTLITNNSSSFNYTWTVNGGDGGITDEGIITYQYTANVYSWRILITLQSNRFFYVTQLIWNNVIVYTATVYSGRDTTTGQPPLSSHTNYNTMQLIGTDGILYIRGTLISTTSTENVYQIAQYLGGAGGAGGGIVLSNFTSSQSGGTGGTGGGTLTGGKDGVALSGNGYAASGGGGGAGQPATNTSTSLYYSGGNSGSGAKIASYLAGSSAFAYGSKYTTSGTLLKAGESGYSITNTYTGGTGGGGGHGLTGNVSSGTVGNGFFGFDGGSPGGGGGGGGAARTIVPNTSTIPLGSGGNGGNGADGGIVITYY